MKHKGLFYIWHAVLVKTVSPQKNKFNWILTMLFKAQGPHQIAVRSENDAHCYDVTKR